MKKTEIIQNFLEAYLEEKAKLENALAVLKAREAAGLTQRDLAKKIWCSTVYNCTN